MNNSEQKIKRVVKMTVSIDVNTSVSVESIKNGIVRGIYRGLDTPPYYVAAPSEVAIRCCEERISDLTEYLEVHYEVVSAICMEMRKDVPRGRVAETQGAMGLGGLYELAKELTDKFVALYEGKQWGGEWLDTVDDFIKGKLFNNTF